MDASQLFKSGKLAEAINAQLPVVKAKPMDHGQRLFLFEMLAFAGDLDRAQRQIEAVQYGQPDIDAAILDYRNLLEAERVRRRVFGEKAQPEFLTAPPEHVRARLAGLMKWTDGAVAESSEAFQLANSQLPVVKGSLNDQPFEGLRDGDDCLGSVLEVMARGHYYWVPLEQIQSVTMSAPRFPRDLLWAPAHLEMQAGDNGQVFLPALYPGSYLESDPQIQLGRLTDWRGDTVMRGVGLKTFFVGAEESSMLDWRKLEIAA